MQGITVLFLLMLFLVGCGGQTEQKPAPKKDHPASSTVPAAAPKAAAAESTSGIHKVAVTEQLATPAPSAPAVAAAPAQADRSDAELWTCYRKARARAKEFEDRNEFDRSIEELLQAADCAMQLDRADIAAWQYNNAAKQGIDLFIHKTSYRRRVAKIGSMNSGTSKNAYVEECRSAFRQYWPVLERARMHLDKALELQQKDNDPQRGAVIRSNRSFVAEVEALIS